MVSLDLSPDLTSSVSTDDAAAMLADRYEPIEIYIPLTAPADADSTLSRTKMIRPCRADELDTIWTIINDGARAYAGVIPADCLKNPYMPMPELLHEIRDGVVFWGFEDNGDLIGVMGIQELGDVTLIRHAYVRTSAQGRGIGGKLLSHLRKQAKKPLLIGTWAAATWAIGFYEKHGFRLLSYAQKEELLPRYWKIPERQKETSVVLASPEWLDRNGHPTMDSEPVRA